MLRLRSLLFVPLALLFAGSQARFTELLRTWPTDVRDHALRIARPAFPTAA